jgi:hypothetical protein
MKERIKSQGTFSVSTNDSYNRLPSRPAKSFRLTNITGKLMAIRQRHSVHILDDFEDGFDGWEVRSGEIKEEPAINLEGRESAILSGTIAKQLPTITDECIVKLKFLSYTDYFKIGIFDTLDRVDLISGGVAGTTVCFGPDGTITTSAPSSSDAKYSLQKEYTLSLELHPSNEVFTANLYDGSTSQVIAQGLDSTNDEAGGGVKAPGENFYLGIQGENLVFDEVLFFKKESYPQEMLPSGSSYIYDCVENIDEYEIANLGSEARGYGDNTDNITITGYYSK